MAAHESLGMQFPYPRVREAWARNYAKKWADTFTSEGTPIHPLSVLPDARRRATGLAEYAIEERDGKWADGTPMHSPSKTELIEEGFKNRHQSTKNYSTWTN